jgi:hypothetical protein
MVGRKSSPSTPPPIHPEEWPARSGKARVLIENPDRADLWAHADLLRKAGYDVAMCGGPTDGDEQERTVCPLVAQGHCPLVDGADVVVSTTSLTDSREIHAMLRAEAAPALVVEGTASELGREGNAVEIAFPVLPTDLVDAVERARQPS